MLWNVVVELHSGERRGVLKLSASYSTSLSFCGKKLYIHISMLNCAIKGTKLVLKPFLSLLADRGFLQHCFCFVSHLEACVLQVKIQDVCASSKFKIVFPLYRCTLQWLSGLFLPSFWIKSFSPCYSAILLNWFCVHVCACTHRETWPQLFSSSVTGVFGRSLLLK